MAGDIVYLIGETHDELGASEYFSMLGAIGNAVPQVDLRKNARAYRALSKAMRAGLIASATPVGRGGLASALAKASIAGQLGAEIDLKKIRGTAKAADSILFSESQGRILISARPEAAALEKTFKDVTLTKIGKVAEKSLSVALPKGSVEISLFELTHAYRAPFKNW